MRQEAQRRPEEPADFSKSDHSWGSAWIEQAKALVGVAGQSQAVVTTCSYRTNPWSLPFSCSLFSLPFSFLSPPTLTSLSPFFDFLCRLPPPPLPLSPPVAYVPDWPVALCVPAGEGGQRAHGPTSDRERFFLTLVPYAFESERGNNGYFGLPIFFFLSICPRNFRQWIDSKNKFLINQKASMKTL